MSNERTACFAADKLKFVKSDPRCSVALLKVIFLLIYCKLKTNFIAKSQLRTWCVRLRESVNKRKIQFSFSKVSASAYESVRLRECVNRKFDWEVKTGI